MECSKQFEPPLNIINLYGAQESRLSVENIKENWEAILKEMIDIKAREENCVLIGDVNRHVGDIIPGNHDKTSPGGKLLLDLIHTGEYALVNALGVAAGGPFTRYDINDPDNDDKKSAIDLVVVSSALVPFIETLQIDNKLNWTPYRVNQGKLKYPDHYTMILTFKEIPIRNLKLIPNQKHMIWNTKGRES